MAKKLIPTYPAKVGDSVILKTDYFTNDSTEMQQLETRHEVLEIVVIHGEPRMKILQKIDWITEASNIGEYEDHLYPFENLIQVLPKIGDQLTLF